MKKKRIPLALSYLIVGVGIGAIAVTISLIITVGLTDILKQILVWLIASGLCGLVSIVYENENLTDITATLIHAPLILLIALCAGWILGYGDGSFSLLLVRMVPVIVLFYVLIHLILFLFRRATVSDINTRLQKKIGRQTGTQSPHFAYTDDRGEPPCAANGVSLVLRLPHSDSAYCSPVCCRPFCSFRSPR